MKLLNALEKRFGFLAIHNLTIYIVVGQLLVFFVSNYAGATGSGVVSMLRFSGFEFLDGGPWRIFSFLIVPSSSGLFRLVLHLYFLYFIGTSLEQHWGAFRYNCFLLVGVLGVLVAGLVFPHLVVPNFFLLSTLIFAIGYLYPNFEILLFFALPVKMKWLAWLDLGLIFFMFTKSPSVEFGAVILGSLINFPIFFAADFFGGLKSKQRVSELKAAKRKFDSEPFHTCVRCGATDQTAPERDFRYRDEGAICSQCLEKDEQS